MGGAEWPLVTIITPSYNQGQFIRATIESVLSQDYPNIEYIIMDGGSSDDTAVVAAEYTDRLTFISEKDDGQSHAINKGFQMARGEIVAWLNSDDIFLPGAVRHAVSALRAHPKAGMAYGEGYQIDAAGNTISRFAVTQPFDLWKLLHLSDYILQQTVFFRRAVFDEVGWLDQDLHYGMDWEIFMRVGLASEVVYIPEYMGAIREYPAAKTSSGGARRAHELLEIMQRHTGKRFPPGALVYGLPTYERIVNTRIGQLFPAPFERVSKKAQSFVTRATHRMVGTTIRDAQGLFADGWAAPRLRYALRPSRGRFFEVRVFLPGWATIDRQTIKFRAQGETFAMESFGVGEFTIPVDVPRSMWTKPLNFTIEAEHSFRPPKPTDGPRDRRRMSYLLREIDYPA